MSPRPRTPTPMPQTTIEFAVQLQRAEDDASKWVGSMLDSILSHLSSLRKFAHKTARDATKSQTSSVIGSEVQSSHSYPRWEEAREQLAAMNESLERLALRGPDD